MSATQWKRDPNDSELLGTGLCALPARDLPTYFNGVAWTPTWPGHPAPNEIRAFGAVSSTYAELIPALPEGPTAVKLTNLTSGRGPMSIVQYPDAASAHTLKIEFNDNDICPPSQIQTGTRFGRTSIRFPSRPRTRYARTFDDPQSVLLA